MSDFMLGKCNILKLEEHSKLKELFVDDTTNLFK